jgi:hypothetical protein
MELREVGLEFLLYDVAQGLLVGSCEQNNEPSGSIKIREIIY